MRFYLDFYDEWHATIITLSEVLKAMQNGLFRFYHGGKNSHNKSNSKP